MARAIAIPVMLVVACLGAAGCGGDDDDSEPEQRADPGTTTEEAPPGLDTARVEAVMRKELDGVELFAIPAAVYPPGGGAPTQTSVGGGRLKVRSVTCPPNVPLERGETFTCELDAGKNTGSVDLTLLNRRGTSLRYKAGIESSDTGEGLPTETELKGKIRVR